MRKENATNYKCKSITSIIKSGKITNFYHLSDIPLLYFFLIFFGCTFFYKENRKIIYLPLLWLIKIFS